MFGELFLINQASKCPGFIFLRSTSTEQIGGHRTLRFSTLFLGDVLTEYEYSKIEEFVCDQFHLANRCRINISFLRTCMFGYCGQD